MIVAVKRAHEPVILEELHALSLLVHFIENKFPLQNHLLLLHRVTVALADEFFCCSAVSSVEDVSVQDLIACDSH